MIRPLCYAQNLSDGIDQLVGTAGAIRDEKEPSAVDMMGDQVVCEVFPLADVNVRRPWLCRDLDDPLLGQGDDGVREANWEIHRVRQRLAWPMTTVHCILVPRDDPRQDLPALAMATEQSEAIKELMQNAD